MNMIRLSLSRLTALSTILIIISLAHGQQTTPTTTSDEETEEVVIPPTSKLVTHPKHFTLDQLAILIDSETETEFAEIESLWNNANTYEWSKALSAEEQQQQQSSSSTSSLQIIKYPYLICHTGINMSGYQRRLAIASSINNSSITNNEEDDAAEDTNEMYFHTLYNEDDYLCVYGQLPPSVAINLNDDADAIIIQPVLSSLKMMEGVVDGMQTEYELALSDEKTAEGYFPVVDMGLCPGVAVAELKKEEDDSGEEEEQTYLDYLMEINGMGNGTTTTNGNATTQSSSSVMLKMGEKIWREWKILPRQLPTCCLVKA